MSIEVSNITKKYGEQLALNNVSFEIKKGEVVGLLGPNGAGKSTMMKILTCFIPQNEGEAKVCGYNVISHPLEVRRQVGYLPENNPLYLDMYVREYLEFIAGIHHLGANTQSQIKKMVKLTGLGPEQHKKIGALSKGYRQRVGLAQAMIHEPEVLILDEPTSGLDPNQLVDIRNLIMTVGKDKTVLLSTHIMQEVEAMCSSVIIINQGVIVANDKTSNMHQTKMGQDFVMVEFAEAVNATLLKGIHGVKNVTAMGGNEYKLEVEGKVDIRPVVFQFAVKNNFTVLSMNRVEHGLEDVFRKLTKK